MTNSNPYAAFAASLTDTQLTEAYNSIGESTVYSSFEDAIMNEYEKRMNGKALYLDKDLITNFVWELMENKGEDQPGWSAIWDHFLLHLRSRLATHRLLPGWTLELEAQVKALIVHVFEQIKDKEQQ